MSGVYIVEKSKNKKLGDCSATGVSQTSCPSSCSFYHNGCYAETGPQGIQTNRLNKSNQTELELALEEAEGIGKLSDRRPLRVHVVGDSKTGNLPGVCHGNSSSGVQRH